MTKLQSWQAALDPAFLQRLLRPSIQPGCIDRRLGEKIISRYQRFANQLPLLPHLLQRQNTLAGFQTDSLPIVYAQLVTPQSSPAITTNNLIQPDQQQTIHQYQTIYQGDNTQSFDQISSQSERPNLTSTHPIQIHQTSVDQLTKIHNIQPHIYQISSQSELTNLTSTHSTQINQTSVDQRPENQTKNQPLKSQLTQSQSTTQPTIIQAKFTDAASLPNAPMSSPSSDRSPHATVAKEQPALVQPLKVEWLRSFLAPSPPPEQAQNSQHLVVPLVTATLPQSALPQSTGIEPFQAGRSPSPTTAAALPIVQVSSGEGLLGQPYSGIGNSSRARMTQPFIFSNPVARPSMPQTTNGDSMAAAGNGMGTLKGNHSRASSPLPTGMAHPSNSTPIVNGHSINGLATAPLQPEAMTAEQVKRLVDVDALTDKIERQLIRRLAVEHERRGWTR
jgi:hypothetical protein